MESREMEGVEPSRLFANATRCRVETVTERFVAVVSQSWLPRVVLPGRFADGNEKCDPSRVSRYSASERLVPSRADGVRGCVLTSYGIVSRVSKRRWLAGSQGEETVSASRRSEVEKEEGRRKVETIFLRR